MSLTLLLYIIELNVSFETNIYNNAIESTRNTAASDMNCQNLISKCTYKFPRYLWKFM